MSRDISLFIRHVVDMLDVPLLMLGTGYWVYPVFMFQMCECVCESMRVNMSCMAEVSILWRFIGLFVKM